MSVGKSFAGELADAVKATETFADIETATAKNPKLTKPSMPHTLSALEYHGDDWRQFSFSEFYTNNNTWQLVRVFNSTSDFSMMWWCTNDTEVCYCYIVILFCICLLLFLEKLAYIGN